MKHKNILLFFVVMMAFSSLGLSQSITTLYAANNGGNTGGAVYFDVTVASNSLSLTGFDINTFQTTTPITVTVYTKVGTSVGNETNLGAWTLAGTATGNVAAGSDNPSPVTLAAPIVLSANTAYGIALVLDANHSHEYTNGTGANQSYSNADLTLNLGQATNFPFAAPIFSPRVWNGTIYYSPVGPPPPPEPVDCLIVCSGDQNVTLAGGECSYILPNLVTVAGNSCVGAVINLISGPAPGTSLAPGTYPIEYELEDNLGTVIDNCSFTVTVSAFPNPSGSLVCNDHVNISADENCEVTLNADMFLEGNSYACYDSYHINIWTFNSKANAINNVTPNVPI